jgi:hypothetical protein
VAEYAGYSRSEPGIKIHLFVGEADGRLHASCGASISKADLIDADGLGDDEPLTPTNSHLCPTCFPALQKWAAVNLD